MHTTTIDKTGGTDHLSCQGVGLPRFEFIQGPRDFGSVIHHINQDDCERLRPDGVSVW